MMMLERLVELLCGTDPKRRRTLQYWAATCVLYVACIGLLLLQVSEGMAEPAAADKLITFGGCGALVFYVLIRVSGRLRLAPDQLAVSQAVFSLACSMAAYAISGPLRGAMLIMNQLLGGTGHAPRRRALCRRHPPRRQGALPGQGGRARPHRVGLRRCLQDARLVRRSSMPFASMRA